MNCKRCGDETTHHKPYCFNHILMMPYAAEIAEVLSNGLEVDCADLLTVLEHRGPQSYRCCPARAVEVLAVRGKVDVVTVGSRRGSSRVIVMLKE